MEVLFQWAKPLLAFADRSPGNLAEGRIPARLNWLRPAPPGCRARASALRPSPAIRAPTPCPANSGAAYKPLQHIAANGPPSGDDAVPLGNPYFQLTQLSFHSGEREPLSPGLRLGRRNRWRRKLKDRSSPNVVETACILAHRQTVNGPHRRLPLGQTDLPNQLSMSAIESGLRRCQGHLTDLPATQANVCSSSKYGRQACTAPG